jgi:tetratricopeptide (TPR) repeat protein
MENGLPVPEPVSVALVCGTQTVQMVQSDLKGQFQFQLASGVVQSNTVISADNDSSMSTNPNGNANNPQGGFVNYGSSDMKLFGCELRLMESGYLPMTKVISEPGSLGMIGVGTLVLQRLANVPGSAISVTSLMVPGNARKEFEKGESAVRSRQYKSAVEHFQKAVALYDKYAAAWNDLGKMQLALNQPDDAGTDFQKAIDADPHYTPPYVNLADLELRQEHYDSAAETAKKALEQDPSVEFAEFIEAAADYKLQRFDEAVKCAQNAQQLPHQDIPQIHALLAQIYVEKHDYPSAAAQMRAYLKESPKGEFAEKVRKSLSQIENASAQTGDSPAVTAP